MVSACITGLFKEFIVFTMILLIHELGHFFAALSFSWKVKKVSIYPFGGITKFEELLNKPLIEELIILIMGPIFQIILYTMIFLFFESGLIRESVFYLFTNYHYTILLFNLLPIYPLDGSKLVKLCFEKVLPFKLSHRLMLVTSYISIIGFICFIIITRQGVNLLMMLSILIFKVIEETTKHRIIFHKFLLERFLYSLEFKKVKSIQGKKLFKMKRDKKHVFYVDGVYKTEKEILAKTFDI